MKGVGVLDRHSIGSDKLPICVPDKGGGEKIIPERRGNRNTERTRQRRGREGGIAECGHDSPSREEAHAFHPWAEEKDLSAPEEKIRHARGGIHDGGVHHRCDIDIHRN